MKFFSPSLTNGVVWNIRSEIHYFRLVHTRYIEKNVNKKLLKICKKQLTGSVNKPGDIIKDPWFSLYKLLMISNKSDVFFTGKNLDLETLKNYWISILRKNNILYIIAKNQKSSPGNINSFTFCKTFHCSSNSSF